MVLSRALLSLMLIGGLVGSVDGMAAKKATKTEKVKKDKTNKAPKSPLETASKWLSCMNDRLYLLQQDNIYENLGRKYLIAVLEIIKTDGSSAQAKEQAEEYLEELEDMKKRAFSDLGDRQIGVFLAALNLAGKELKNDAVQQKAAQWLTKNGLVKDYKDAKAGIKKLQEETTNAFAK